MTEQECLERMVAPGTPREGKYRKGVIQIHITRACDKSCFNCTQGSNFGGKTEFMSPEHFELAVRSLGFKDGDGIRRAFEGFGDGRYFGVVGVFGGNPALSPYFPEYCAILKRLVPFNQRGLWCNNPVTLDKAKLMAETFDPSVSNLNVHLDRSAYDLFKLGWPQCRPVGLDSDSRHSPVFVAMKDVVKRYEYSDDNQRPELVPDEDRIWELISNCDINQHWSAMIGVFRGELRAWFCEVAGAQAMLHQHEPKYPDTGMDPTKWYQYASDRVYDDSNDVSTGAIRWWQRRVHHFASQVRKHCFECGVPLRGYGELAQADHVEHGKMSDPGDSLDVAHEPREQVSAMHAGVAKPKRPGRRVEVVTELVQLGIGRIGKVNHYLQNASK